MSDIERACGEILSKLLGEVKALVDCLDELIEWHPANHSVEEMTCLQVAEGDF